LKGQFRGGYYVALGGVLGGDVPLKFP